MLTGMVNIAVFAAFRMCAGPPFALIAEFKPVCGDRQLDIPRYRRQKWQDRGKNGKDVARGCCRFAARCENSRPWPLSCAHERG